MWRRLHISALKSLPLACLRSLPQAAYRQSQEKQAPLPVRGSDSRLYRVYEFFTRATQFSVIAKGGNMNRLRIGTSGEPTKSRFSGLVNLVAILLVAGASTQAFAQCGTPKRFMAGGAWKFGPGPSASVCARHPGLPSMNRQERDGGREPIVGLWRIIATDDAGNIVDRVISGWT